VATLPEFSRPKKIKNRNNPIPLSIQSTLFSLFFLCGGLLAAVFAKPDWLPQPDQYPASITISPAEKSITLTNGLITRTFHTVPNLATVSLKQEITGEEFLRSLRPSDSGRDENLAGSQYKTGHTQVGDDLFAGRHGQTAPGGNPLPGSKMSCPEFQTTRITESKNCSHKTGLHLLNSVWTNSI
jgi:hypothetical protein